jgi:predicted dinucleotide-binding enzyme
MSSAQLRAEWMRVHKVAAPPISADLLARGIAWRLQEKAHGGFTSTTFRELQRLKRQLDSSGSVSVNAYEGRIKPGTRLVRAFNAINSGPLARDGFRKPERLGIPLASDDAEALKIASQLVSDAGFDPVVVGGLSRARDFDYGTPVYVRGMTAAELRKALNLK